MFKLLMKAYKGSHESADWREVLLAKEALIHGSQSDGGEMVLVDKPVASNFQFTI